MSTRAIACPHASAAAQHRHRPRRWPGAAPLGALALCLGGCFPPPAAEEPERSFVSQTRISYGADGEPIVAYRERVERGSVDLGNGVFIVNKRVVQHVRGASFDIGGPVDANLNPPAAGALVANSAGALLSAFPAVLGGNGLALHQGYLACMSTAAAPAFDCEDIRSPGAGAQGAEVAVALNETGQSLGLFTQRPDSTSEAHEIHARYRPANGRWSLAAVKLADAARVGTASVPGIEPKLVFAADGTGHALYVDADRKLLVRRYLGAFDQWQAPLTLASLPPFISPGNTRLLLRPGALTADAMALWTEPGAGGRSTIRFVRYIGIGWTGLPALPEAGCADAFDAAMARNGDALLVWTCDGRVHARSYRGGQWGALESLGDTDSGGGPPRVAVDAVGNGVAVWRRGLQMFSASLVADRGWLPAVELGAVTEGNARDDYSVAMSENGRARAAWVRSLDPADWTRGTRLQTAPTGPFTLALSALRHHFGGSAVSVKLTLGAPATANTRVLIGSSFASATAQVPAVVVVPAGQAEITFSVSTSAVDAFVSGNISAQIESRPSDTGLAELSLMPEPALTGSLNPPSVLGGQATSLRIVSSRAYPVAFSFDLSSDSPLAQLPPAVALPPGVLSVEVPVTTLASASAGRAVLQARLRQAVAGAALDILPTPLGPVQLDVAVVGPGTLISTPPGIHCGSAGEGSCSAVFTLNTGVQLAAIGSDGALLQDVTGDPDCADRNLRMDAPKQCVASFSSSFGSWQRMGDAVNTPTAQQAPALALDTAELPVLASIERGAAAVDFVVMRRFTGVWQALGPPLGGGVNHATSPTLVVDPANNPVLAWTEGDGTRSNVYLARYSLARSRYEPVGASNLPLNFTPNSRATWPALAVHPSGLLMLAWVENGVPVAKFFDGLGWRALPAGAGPAGRTTAAPKLVLDGAGFAVLAWVDADAPGAVHVARAGSNGWAELGALALGPSPAAETFVNGLGLAVDGADRPLVAWMQGGLQAYASYVRRWDGSQWQPIEAAPSNTTAADGFAFAVNGSGQPVVVVTQPRVGGHTVRRARFNGLDWVEPALLSTDTRLVGMQLAVPPSDFDGAVLSWLRTQPGPVLEAWRYFP